MNAIYSTGVVHNGRIEFAEPPSWPEGTEVIVMPNASQESEVEPTPQEIAQTLAAMDNIRPLEMSEEEFAAWENDRRLQREFEKANFEARGAALQGNWE